MFRENTDEIQEPIFDTLEIMDRRVRNKFDKSWAPVFYEYVFTKIDERPFEVLYGDTGNPNFPVNILLSLEFIKHMKNQTDLEMLDGYHFDYLVNYALGNRNVGQRNLAERTIYNFRERIYKYLYENPDKEDILFDQFNRLAKVFIQKANISTREQRMDTTMFSSNIKNAGRLGLVYDVLVNTIMAIPEESRTERLKKALTAEFKKEYLFSAKPDVREGNIGPLLNLCREAADILEGIPGRKDSKALRIARRLFKDHAAEDPATGLLQPLEKVSPAALQSAYDEDATYRKKLKKHVGYVLSVTETCVEDNPFQVITDLRVEPNIKSDSAILEENLSEIKKNTGCTDLYVDGGFHTPGVREKAEKEDVNLHFTGIQGKKVQGKIPFTEFVTDDATNIIKECPKGHKPIQAGVASGQTSAHFEHSVCDKCEMRNICRVKRQKRDYAVRIDLKALNTARERQEIEAARVENTSKRAGIEGTNSAMKRSQGLEKLRVRGLLRSRMECCFKVASQNIRRFTKYMQGGYDRKPKRYCNEITVPIPA